SKGEPLEGQLAVAEVILNRTESGRFPSSVRGASRAKRDEHGNRARSRPCCPTCRRGQPWRRRARSSMRGRPRAAAAAGRRGRTRTGRVA
ncbi:cell wall hydrolase, partial [Sphingomonas koreensis]